MLKPGARVLIVRLSALGDIVHALPVLAALRRRDATVAVDWLVEEAYASVLALASGVNTRVVVRAKASRTGAGEVTFGGGGGYLEAIAFLRRQRYDVALDLQGLIKSAAWARLSGAKRVIGFDPVALRERQAAWFYTETVAPPVFAHVIRKNLSIAERLGADLDPIEVPISSEPSPALLGWIDEAIGPARYAVINPGAAWPNKRWPPDRFGALANRLLTRYGLQSFVTWGPNERELAERVAAASDGAARPGPATDIADLTALLRGASLVVSGDTGPLHLAAAVGAPVVGLYGPTWPERNGPWLAADETISRAGQCHCHHKRRCLVGAPCVDTIGLDEVLAAVDRRIALARQTA